MVVREYGGVSSVSARLKGHVSQVPSWVQGWLAGEGNVEEPSVLYAQPRAQHPL